MAKNLQKSVLGLALGNMFLMVSLKAKLKACVGEVPDDVGQVSAPEGQHSLLR